MTKQTERINFVAHPQLLWQTIHRQAGSLAKALLEGIMNSVDAQATRCDILISRNEIMILDDGKGFPTREQILQAFRVFGLPQDEQKTYGTFRIGRGQMFAYGKNTWCSGRHKMVVDVKNCDVEDLGFELSDSEEEPVDGCEIVIELYTQLTRESEYELVRNLEQLVKWVAIPVTLVHNDEEKLISGDPADAKWDYESDQAYIRLRESGDLKIYNLGVFVESCASYRYGRGGEVVSKQALQVNQARNQVQSSCPVWQEVQKKVRELAGTAVKKKGTRRLNDDERLHYLERLLAGDFVDDAKNLKLFVDVGGRHLSLSTLRNQTHSIPITTAPAGDRIADRVQQTKAAMVLSDTTRDELRCDTLEELQKTLARLAQQITYASSSWPRVVEFASLAETYDSQCLILEPKDWSLDEQIKIAVAQQCADLFTDYQKSRKCLLGLSDTMEGWTDGERIIGIERKWLSKHDPIFLHGLTEIALLIQHELCHEDSNIETHVHGAEYFEAYHTLSARLPHVLRSVAIVVPRIFEQFQRKLTKRQLRELDNQDGRHKRGLQAAARMKPKE